MELDVGILKEVSLMIYVCSNLREFQVLTESSIDYAIFLDAALKVVIRKNHLDCCFILYFLLNLSFRIILENRIEEEFTSHSN